MRPSYFPFSRDKRRVLISHGFMWNEMVVPSPTGPDADVFQQSGFRGADMARKFNGHVALAAFTFHEARDGVRIVKAFHLLQRVQNHVVAIGFDEGVVIGQAALLSRPLFLRAGVLRVPAWPAAAS